MSEVASEWLFRYQLIPPADTSDDEAFAIAQYLVHEAAVTWAEEHKFGIGGGAYKKLNFKTFDLSSPMYHCVLDFGLCPTGDDEAVSKAAADELLDVLSGRALERGANLEG